MLLSSTAEATCFFLGALSDMPAVYSFALNAGFAILIDFLMQITAFISLMALDMARQENNRVDIFCCVKVPKNKKKEDDNSVLYKLFDYFYAPALLSKWVRPVVVVGFFGWFCASLAVAPRLYVGLDQEISMPDDSYVLDYFEYMKDYLSVGPPFYVVMNTSDLQYDFTDTELQNKVAGSFGSNADSLQATILLWSKESNTTYVATPAQSWIDDYFAWNYASVCCRYNPQTKGVCQSNYPEYNEIPPGLERYKRDISIDSYCTPCDEPGDGERPDRKQFRKRLKWFWEDCPGDTCPSGGKGAYRYGNAFAFNI